MSLAASLGLGVGIFPYRYIAVLKISRKSGAGSCSTPLVSSKGWISHLCDPPLFKVVMKNDVIRPQRLS